jgi:serine/threonine-protein kinase
LITRDLRTSTNQQPAEPGELRGGVLSVRLKFIRLIGAGGMGQVWEAASDDLPGQRFAVKVVAAEHAKDPRTVSRFFGEARAAGAIDDPNIVMVYGTGRTDDGRPALVMPYIEGQSLADMCDELGPLPLDAVGKIMLQLASAVRAAHGAGIVHRDIKPQNVMVMMRRWGREWFVILVDFGICKFHDVELAGDIHTMTNQYIGTPGYSAPEQILGKTVTAKTDIYALGVLAYRILCGRTPYIGDSNMEVMTQQCDANASFPEPRYWRQDIPHEWNDLIILCLERDPARRPTAPELGRWIAAGMKNGASMLTSLAPQIAAETRASANAETISSDVPTALAQIQALSRRGRSRRGQVASLAAAAFVGVVSTTVAFKLAGSIQEQPAHAVMQPSVAQTHEVPAQTRPIAEANSGPSTPSVSPRGGMTGTATEPPPEHQRPSGSQAAPPAHVAAGIATNGSREASAKPAASAVPAADVSDSRSRSGTRTAEPVRTGPGVMPDAPRSPTSGTAEGTSPPEPVRSRRATGTLDIRAKTWADCFLSDGGAEVSIGTAPTTVTDLTVGRHRVRCKNEGQHKDETVTVTIDATKTAVIEKNW